MRLLPLVSALALGGLALFIATSANAGYNQPQFSYAELDAYLNADGSANFQPNVKPAINSDDFFSSSFGLSGAPQGLGEFDFGAWETEVEPWGVQNIQSDILVNEDEIDVMNVNQLIVAVAEHLKQEEGFRPYVYDDVNGRPWSESKRGNPTIGFGHLVTAADVAKYGWGWTVDENDAYILLLQDVNKHLAPIVPYVTVPLTLPQWVAVTSLAYNAGPHGVKKSKFIKAVNAGNIAQAEAQFKDWNKATIKVDGVPQKRVVPGLVNRRNKEWALFMQPAQVVYLDNGGIYA